MRIRNKAVLFIGSESYDAPVITVLQGLNELGFKIYTIKKPNINSWFCNQIINDPNDVKFDFILSNLHWGTRWTYFSKYKLNKYVKVLIDGDDNKNDGHWRKKYDRYKKIYKTDAPEDIKNRDLSPYRWVESLGDYEPDIVFTSQKPFNSNSFYLPFGVHNEYLRFFENKSMKNRTVSVLHVLGPGKKRLYTKIFLSIMKPFLPGRVVNQYINGEKWVPEEIKTLIQDDDNIHSYHRWTFDLEYFKYLNNSKVLIYPGVDSYPFYDSKRPWESYASGTLVFFKKPNIDDTQYPFTTINSELVYSNLFDLFYLLRKVLKNPRKLEQLEANAEKTVSKKFHPKPIANYFLQQIMDNT